MKAKIKRTYEATAKEELSIDWNGHNFLVIIGEHINGWYIAIPNWNVCTEAGYPTNNFYNGEKLANALNDENMGISIADAIKEYWNNRFEE